MRRVIRKLKYLAAAAWYEPAFWLLVFLKHRPLHRYRKLRTKFQDTYRAIEADMTEHTTPSWISFNTSLEKSLLPIPPHSFLRDPVISSTMVMTKGGAILKEELKWLGEHSPNLLSVAGEDAVGHPRIISWKYLTSHNTIHHAYHLGRFLKATGADIASISRVVEWGGGYGNLAKLYRRLIHRNHSWVIVDTPLLCTLQWLYLSAVFGPERVRLITGPDQPTLENGITIIPVQWFERYDLKADLFVSTWAISESPRHLQDKVAKDWFGARHLLIGYQDSGPGFMDAGHVGELARQAGADIEELPHMPGNHYAFR